ncbi:MAG TPA: hypothetical protein VF469_40055 [Kofleriaceae bacterium]
MARREVARDVVYLGLLTIAWYSVFVCVLAYVDPSANPAWRVFTLDGLAAKATSAAALIGWALLVLLQPEKTRALAILRRFLSYPTLGSHRRFIPFAAGLVVLAVGVQVPVWGTARMRLHACTDEVKVCSAAGERCVRELVRVAPGSTTYVRVARGEPLIALARDDRVLWEDVASGPSYSESDLATELCVQTEFELACTAQSLQVFAKNEGIRTLSIFGFTLQPVYDAIYPEVAARVGVVPTYEPLAIDLGAPTPAATTGPVLVEVAKNDSGLVSIPLVLKRPDDKTIYVHAVRVCPKLRLSGAPHCLPGRLVIFTASSRSTQCEAATDDDLAKRIGDRLAALAPLDSTDDLKLLAAIRPAETESLVLRTFGQTRAEHVALRLDLLDVMAYLPGPASTAKLAQVQDDQGASTSERLRALLSHSRRDKAVNKVATLSGWVRDANADLASRALELLPIGDQSAACAQRLAGLRCDDGMLYVHCQSLGDAALSDPLQAWRSHCSTPFGKQPPP